MSSIGTESRNFPTVVSIIRRMNSTAFDRILRPVLAGVIPVLLFAGCSSSEASEPTTPATVSSIVPVPVVDPISHLTVQGAAGDVVDSFDAEDYAGCVRRTAVLARAGGRIEVTVWAATCGTTEAMNGRHGTYATIDDPAVPTDATPVTLPIGRAVAFTQTYTEYTNSANEHDEPVVLIALADPVSDDYPMAMVVSPAGHLDAAAVLEIARSLTITN